MISADTLPIFTHRGAAEFAAPDDEGGARLVDIFADLFEVAVEVLAGTAVAVPVGVVKLHEAGAAFDEAAGVEPVLSPQEGPFLPQITPAYLIAKPLLSEG